MAALIVADVIKFEISLGEIIDACRQLLVSTKDQAVRDAVKTMFLELKKGDDALIDLILAPLFELDTQTGFKREFAGIRAKFKSYVLKGRGLLSQIQCGTVTDKLKVLRQSQAWKKHIPLVNRSLLRLDMVTDKWIADDSELFKADQRVQEQINEFLDEVAKKRKSAPTEAFAMLQAGLKDIEDSFVRMKKHLAQLEALSLKL